MKHYCIACFFLVLVAGGRSWGSVPSGTSSPLRTDFQETLWRYAASAGSNPSFLSGMECGRISYLQAEGSYGSGKLVNYYQSDSRLGGLVSTESYWRLNSRLVLGGAMAYGTEKGKHMSGSAFLHPEETPFDIVEMDDSGAGTKRHEWYMLKGEAGYLLTPRLSWGGQLEYRTENYAKFKDLRHQNSLMNLHLSTGFSYELFSGWQVGLSYGYLRNVETVGFGIYGTTDRQYTSLISFGGFYGRSEVFGESGYTSNTTPLFTQTHEVAFQGQYHRGDLHWFQEVFIRKTSGRFGSGSSTSITYSTHTGSEVGYRAKLTWQQSRLFQAMELGIALKSLENRENSYKESTDGLGVSQIVYYGSNEVMSRDQLRAWLAYQLLSGGKESRSDWSAEVRLDYRSRSVTASQYPFFRKQNLHVTEMWLQGARNWYKGRQVWTASAGLGLQGGWGCMKEDGQYASVSENQQRPAERADLLVEEYDYQTAVRLVPYAAVGYEREITPALSGYVRCEVTYARAFTTTMAGKDFVQPVIKVGVKF